MNDDVKLTRTKFGVLDLCPDRIVRFGNCSEDVRKITFEQSDFEIYTATPSDSKG